MNKYKLFVNKSPILSLGVKLLNRLSFKYRVGYSCGYTFNRRPGDIGIIWNQKISCEQSI